MIRDSAISFSLLALCVALGAAPAYSADSPTIKSDAKSLDIWTDGFTKSDSDKIVGLALGLTGPLRFEAKAGVQQHADPHVADSEKLLWSVTTPAAYQLSHSVDLNLSSGRGA